VHLCTSFSEKEIKLTSRRQRYRIRVGSPRSKRERHGGTIEAYLGDRGHVADGSSARA